jgi:hypothetical protein
LVLAATSCHDSSDCSCADYPLSIDANPLSAQSMTLSGSACTDGTIYSYTASGNQSGFVANASNYTVYPESDGDCTVTVLLSTGETVQSTTTIYRVKSGCCPGLYPEKTDLVLADFSTK